MKRRELQGGFTFIEILVATAILAILATVVLFAVQEMNKKARDAQRLNDLEQLELALRIYTDVHADASNDIDVLLPNVDAGELVGDRIGTFDTSVAPYLADAAQDPLDNRDTHGYYYNSNYNCNGTTTVLLVALTMEKSDNTNWPTCAGTDEIITGVVPSADSYVVIIRKY